MLGEKGPAPTGYPLELSRPPPTSPAGSPHAHLVDPEDHGILKVAREFLEGR